MTLRVTETPGDTPYGAVLTGVVEAIRSDLEIDDRAGARRALSWGLVIRLEAPEAVPFDRLLVVPRDHSSTAPQRLLGSVDTELWSVVPADVRLVSPETSTALARADLKVRV